MGWGRWRSIALILFTIIVCGCIPIGCGLETATCEIYVKTTGKDIAHCYQWLAVENEDPEACEKVNSDTWANSGQNPPKDKCFMLIAAATEDPDICLRMKGGTNSYTPFDCYLKIGEEGGMPDVCKGHKEEARCRSAVAYAFADKENIPIYQIACGAGWTWVQEAADGKCVQEG